MAVDRRAVVVTAPALGLPSGAAQAEPLVERIHVLIPGVAGGGWNGTLRGTGEALVRSDPPR
jgi:putative tricarboxylic transport membrane protein